MTKDLNKGITAITYNHLNQPVEIVQGTNRTVYTYTATGGMLKSKIYSDEKIETETEYAGAFIYQNSSLSYINIRGCLSRGGRIIAEDNEYQYHLTDHLGNVRVSFIQEDRKAKIIQEDHYYPFRDGRSGMRMNEQHYTNTDLLNKFLYNGKELQDQTGFYDYLPVRQAGGFRQYDPQIARWHVIDAMAESYASQSPYHFAGNNPISNIEINGMEYLIGPDGSGGWLWGEAGDVSIGGGKSSSNWYNFRGFTSFYGDNSGNYSVDGVGAYHSDPGPSYEEVQERKEREQMRETWNAVLSGAYFYDAENNDFHLYSRDLDQWWIIGTDENDPDDDNDPDDEEEYTGGKLFGASIDGVLCIGGGYSFEYGTLFSTDGNVAQEFRTHSIVYGFEQSIGVNLFL